MKRWWIYALVPVITLSAAFAYVDAPPTFVLRWGSLGAAPGQFSLPEDMAVGPDTTIYVADTNNHRIQKFDKHGAFLIGWGMQGYGLGQFQSPSGIAVDGQGEVYVSDRYNERIQVFGSDGGFLRAWDIKQDGLRRSYAWGIAIGPDGYVYVAAWDPQRIQVYSKMGDFIREWSTTEYPGEHFTNVKDLAIDPTGNVYVTGEIRSGEYWDNGIKIFTNTGEFKDIWIGYGSGPGQFKNLCDITIDHVGNIYSVEGYGTDRVQKFDNTGYVRVVWGQCSGEDHCLDGGSLAITVDACGDIYVANAHTGTIQRFTQGAVQAHATTWGRMKALYR